jgi:hypothetical protein
MARYVDTDDHEWFAIARRGNRIACCDCGLVHVVNARIHRDGIELSFARNARATASTRRQSKYPYSPTATRTRRETNR